MSETSEEKSVVEAAPVESNKDSAKESAPARSTRSRKSSANTKAAEGSEAEVAASSAENSEAAEKPKRRTRTRKKDAEEASSDIAEPKKATNKKSASKKTTKGKSAEEEGSNSVEESDSQAKPKRASRTRKAATEGSETKEKPKRRTRSRKPEDTVAPEPSTEAENVFSDTVSPEELMRIIAEAKAAKPSSEAEPSHASEDAEVNEKPKRRTRTRRSAKAEGEQLSFEQAEIVEVRMYNEPADFLLAEKTSEDSKAKPLTSDEDNSAASSEAVVLAESGDSADTEVKVENPAEASDSAEASSEDAGEEHGRRKRRYDSRDENSERNREDSRNRDDARNRRREKFEQRKKNKRERNKPVQPKTSREELAAMKVADLRAKADELGVDHKGVLKAALVDLVYDAAIKAEGFVEVEGILDIMSDGFGFIRTNGYLSGPKDAYVHASMVRRNGLRKGDKIKGQTRPARQGDKFPALQTISTVNGIPLEELGHRVRFADLTPVFPDERLVMEHGKNTITARVIDLCAPIGKGQRGLIVSPPKAGKTTVLKNIAAAISANNPEVHLICLLVDERPEEVTDMERSIHGEVVASTFDMPCENHIACAEMVIERAKRLVENGEDVVVLLDSLTRLARAYNLAQPASGRILSGGVDSTALYPPKKFLGAARNIENGGSLTILASALVETGSKMDEVIFEEFKGTGNMELKLDRQLAERRIFPAIDPVSSGTRREDLLLDPQEAPLIWAVRRILSNRNNTERAMETLIKSLHATKNNQEFLVRTAKKAQNRSKEEIVEF